MPDLEHNKATVKALKEVTKLVLDVKDPSVWDPKPIQSGDGLHCRVTHGRVAHPVAVSPVGIRRRRKTSGSHDPSSKDSSM